MSREERPRGAPLDFNLVLRLLMWIVILIIVLVAGYLILSAVNALSAPFTGIPQAIGTQAQQFINPTPTIIASPVTVIKQVRALSRLETASFTIEKVITAETGEGPFGFLFQDKLLLIAEGEVIAGIDLGRIGDEDIKVSGNSVFVTLPASEIFEYFLNEENTRVYSRDTGLLGQQKDLETLARQEAERAILAGALEHGILDMAQDNAEQVIRSLIEGLGFDDVTFVRATPAPDQDRGESGP